MRSIQATGKSVDAAIFSGLTELGLSIDEVSIDIVQRESKGILGIGAKPAIVTLTEKPQEEVVVPDFAAELERERRERNERRERRNDRDRRDNRENRDRHENREERPAQEASEPAKAEAPEKARGEQSEAAHREPRRERRPRNDRPERREQETVPAEEQPAEEPIVYTEEAAANEPAAQFVSGLIDKMHIEGSQGGRSRPPAHRLQRDGRSDRPPR